MSLLAMSVSHRTAPFDVIEKVTLAAADASEVSRHATELDHVRECLTLATCNRVDMYFDTDSVDETVTDVIGLLARSTGVPAAALEANVRIVTEDKAISHIFRVAAGLDSMVLGEVQILGQLRDALTRSQLDDTIGPELNAVVQKALKAGKRAHAETGIDRFAPSVVTAALDQAGERIADSNTQFLIAGAGTMSVLAVLTLVDRGVSPAQIVVSNRAFGRALDLAERHGITAVKWEALDRALLDCDVLISCTGAADVIFPAARLAPAVAARTPQSTELLVLDLALPRDVGAKVRDLDGVRVIDLETLRDLSADHEREAALVEVESIVEWDIAAHIASRRSALVAPTVTALHDKARDVVELEFSRVESRLAGLDPVVRQEVYVAMQRVARKLIHRPTVRLKEIAVANDVDAHIFSLSELFELGSEVDGTLLSKAGDA
jgi:glutamyl-tRNA reductase